MLHSSDVPGSPNMENPQTETHDGSIPLPATLTFKPRVSPHLPANKEAAPIAKKISDSCPDGGVGNLYRFKCNFPDCDLAFKRRYNLKVHTRKHTKETPYRCPFQGCSKSYKWRSSLAHHTKRKHRKEANDMIQKIETEKVATRSAVMALTDMRIKSRLVQDPNNAVNIAQTQKVTNSQNSGEKQQTTNTTEGMNVEGNGFETPSEALKQGMESWTLGNGEWDGQLNAGFGYQAPLNGAIDESKKTVEIGSVPGSANINDKGKRKQKRKGKNVVQGEEEVAGAVEDVPSSPVSATENPPLIDATSLFPPDGRHLLPMGMMDFDMGNPSTEALGIENTGLFAPMQYGDPRIREFFGPPQIYYPYMMAHYGV